MIPFFPSLPVHVGAKNGSSRKDVYEQRTLSGSEAFSLLICLQFVLPSVCTIDTISQKPLPTNAKRLLPVDVRC